MRMTFQGAAKALLFAVAAVLSAGSSSCHETSSSVPANVTVDDRAMVLHAVHAYASQDASAYNTVILVVDITYKNLDQLPQAIQPNKFVLIDQQTLAQYQALDGGDIHIPPAVNTTLDPEKTIDLSLGFRVSPNLIAAHLSYSP